MRVVPSRLQYGMDGSPHVWDEQLGPFSEAMVDLVDRSIPSVRRSLGDVAVFDARPWLLEVCLQSRILLKINEFAIDAPRINEIVARPLKIATGQITHH